MTRFPVTPKLRQYRGSNARLQRKNRDYNEAARMAAAHLNKLIANNDSENQQYMFADIAHDLGISTDDARSALSNGGYNGITFLNINDEDRQELSRFKTKP